MSAHEEKFHGRVGLVLIFIGFSSFLSHHPIKKEKTEEEIEKKEGRVIEVVGGSVAVFCGSFKTGFHGLMGATPFDPIIY